MLPRPGPWIVTLKRLLSLALIATALWLLSVLLIQSGIVATALIGVLMVAMGLMLWRRKALAGGARLAGGAAAALLALAAFLAPLPFDSARSGSQVGFGAGPSDQAVEMDWENFDRPAIAGLVAGGQVVFVDVTADWCLTCQANKQLVLHRGTVAERLGADDVVPMQADWTLPDDGIANFLASYGRYGIPFYVVYGPGAPDGLILPELLTTDIVLEAVEQARHAG
jgi:suppressor for copper-sensitivity B